MFRGACAGGIIAVATCLGAHTGLAQEDPPQPEGTPDAASADPEPAELQTIDRADCTKDAAELLRFVDGADTLFASKARTKLEHCGPSLLPILSALLDGPSREKGSSVRGIFRTVARHSPISTLRPFLTTLPSEAPDRIDRLRALEPRLPDMADEAQPILDALWHSNLPMPSRYLLLSPTATMARAEVKASVDQLTSLIASDPDSAIRAHALDVSESTAGLHASRIMATRDPAPRVRDAAVRALVEEPGPDTETALLDRLYADGWTFVRVTAASALGSLPPSAAADRGLASELGSAPVRVKIECIAALANHKDTHSIGAIRARAKDDDESPDVRAAAIEALGKLCSRDDSGWIGELAQENGSADAPALDSVLGQAAIGALRMLQSTSCRP